MWLTHTVIVPPLREEASAYAAPPVRASTATPSSTTDREKRPIKLSSLGVLQLPCGRSAAPHTLVTPASWKWDAAAHAPTAERNASSHEKSKINREMRDFGAVSNDRRAGPRQIPWPPSLP